MSAPLLVYDGDCSFCTATARWIEARWRVRADAIPWQRLTPEELARLGLTLEDVRCAAWWIDHTGRRSGGHLAIARALAGASGPYRAAGLLLLVPPFRWLGAAAYPVIARLRHRLPGGSPACRL